MKIRWPIALGIAVVAASCARFDHQTTASEPHGLVQFEPSSDRFLEEPIPKTLDGLPISTGREYRVRPGTHELVYQVFELYDEKAARKTSTTNNTNAAPANAASKSETVYAISTPGTGRANRRFALQTNVVSVEAGWRYRVIGDEIKRTKLED